ncbi:LysE family translocator [Pantoea sp. At-9b]|uniref:LysE family translocator n=1 Tax=Pantoea sp. (strain At-9b) TaxID=592316 RepID=UPI0001B3E5D9|nr:LysE family transporter [Pantoea sp. At-9b]ADU72876.1 Lysine exporter protein (LYSE/YGGA) [Pantoea sp. At-9b]
MLLSSLMAIAAVLVMGVISPGPSFIYVARNAVARSRLHGLLTALGMGTGAAIFSIMAMFGLEKILVALPELFTGLKIAGGLYLIWMGYKIAKNASKPFSVTSGSLSETHSLFATWRDGLLTQLSNPKTALVFASIFTALLPKEIPGYFYYILPLMAFVIDAGWYSLVAVLLSSKRPRDIYLRLKRAIDTLSSTILVLLGVKIILTSFQK